MTYKTDEDIDYEKTRYTKHVIIANKLSFLHWATTWTSRGGRDCDLSQHKEINQRAYSLLALPALFNAPGTNSEKSYHKNIILRWVAEYTLYGALEYGATYGMNFYFN